MSAFKFEGSKYNETSRLYGAELLSAIRKEIKSTFPDFKFKINKRHHNSFNFLVMSGPIDLMTVEGIQRYGKYSNQVNPYWVYDHHHEEGIFTYQGRLMLYTLSKLINSFNFDDSDIQTDYFHTRFYLHIEVGDGNIEYKVKK